MGESLGKLLPDVGCCDQEVGSDAQGSSLVRLQVNKIERKFFKGMT